MIEVEDIIRIGQVSSVYPETCTARVAFDDLDDFVSAPLAILQQHTAGMQFYSLPQIGEHVLCVFLPSGKEMGFIIGSFYTNGNPPPVDGEGGMYISGNVSIGGDVDVGGSVDAGGQVTASDDVVGGGISLKTHRHSGVETGGGNTGTPI